MTEPPLSPRYYYDHIVSVVAVGLSLLTSSIVLKRVLQRDPPGLILRKSYRTVARSFHESRSGLGTHPCSRLFDTLVYVLSAIQVYMYVLTAIFYPLLWRYPDIQLFGRLERRWVLSAIRQPRMDRMINFTNLILVMPAYWMELWWHVVIAYALYALVAQRLPPETIQNRLPILFLVVFMVVAAKGAIMVAAMLTGQLTLHSISSVVMYSILCVLISGLYTMTVYSLWAADSQATMLRAIRTRLLLVLSYVVLHLVCKVALVSGGAPALPWVLWMCSFMSLFQGCYDAIVLGNIFSAKTCRWLRPRTPSMPHRRQTTDSRIRVGASVTTTTNSKVELSTLAPPSFSSVMFSKSVGSLKSGYGNQSAIETSFLGLDDLVTKSCHEDIKSDDVGWGPFPQMLTSFSCSAQLTTLSEDQEEGRPGFKKAQSSRTTPSSSDLSRSLSLEIATVVVHPHVEKDRKGSRGGGDSILGQGGDGETITPQHLPS